MQVLTALEPDRIAGLRDRNEFFWLDLTAPAERELTRLAEVLDLAALAVQDLEGAFRTPHLDTFEGYLMLVYFGVGGGSRGPFDPVEVRMIISGSYIVTVHDGRCEMLEELSVHLRDRADVPEGIVVYKVLDALTDSFFAALDAADERIEALEVAVLSRPRRAQLAELVGLKSALVPVRKIATRQRNTSRRAEDAITELPGLDAGPHDFRDIPLRMESVVELLDSSRDVLSGAQDVYLNSVTERLTLVATIFFPLTVLTGFFGMNFGWMVDHVDSLADFLVFGVGSIVAVTIAVLAAFWRAGYLGAGERG